GELLLAVWRCGEHLAGAQRSPGVLEQVDQGAAVQPGTEPPGDGDEPGPAFGLSGQGLAREGACEDARIEAPAGQSQPDEGRVGETHCRAAQARGDVER